MPCCVKTLGGNRGQDESPLSALRSADVVTSFDFESTPLTNTPHTPSRSSDQFVGSSVFDKILVVEKRRKAHCKERRSSVSVVDGSVGSGQFDRGAVGIGGFLQSGHSRTDQTRRDHFGRIACGVEKWDVSIVMLAAARFGWWSLQPARSQLAECLQESYAASGPRVMRFRVSANQDRTCALRRSLNRLKTPCAVQFRIPRQDVFANGKGRCFFWRAHPK